MAKGFNIRAFLGLETKEYEQGVKRSKRQADQLSRGMTQSFSGAFGSMKGMLSKFTGGLSDAFSGVAGGIKTGTKSLGAFSKALVATGIGALILAITSLVSYFTKTEEGADRLKRVTTGLGAVMDAVGVVFSKVGKSIADMFVKLKNDPKLLWEAIKTNLLNRIKAIPQYFIESAKVSGNAFKLLGLKIKKIIADIPIIGKPLNKAEIEENIKAVEAAMVESSKKVGTTLVQFATGLDEEGQKKVVAAAKKVGKEVVETVKGSFKAGTEVADMEKALKLRKRAFIITEQEISNKKSELLLKSRDMENTTAQERLDAIVELRELTKEQYAEKRSIMEDEIALLEATQALGDNNAADNEKLAQLKAQQLALTQQENTALREIENRYTTATKENEKQLQIQRDIAEQKAYDATELGALELQLKQLTEDQLKFGAVSAEVWKQYQDNIDDANAKIDEFKGKSKELSEEEIARNKLTADSINIMGDAFAELAAGTEDAAETMKRAIVSSIKVIVNAMLVKAIASIWGAEASKGVVGLAVAAAGSGIIAGVFSGLMSKFEDGGIVGGTSYHGDKQMIRVNSGEMVLNQRQQKNLFDLVNHGGNTSNGSGEVQLRVKGRDLVGVLGKNFNKSNSF
jgi:hypothetical protein